VGAPIDGIEIVVYTVPTDSPEADCTLPWEKTTRVVVEGGMSGICYTHADTAAARLVKDLLTGEVKGKDALSIPTKIEA
jgi:hypothetical protein